MLLRLSALLAATAAIAPAPVAGVKIGDIVNHQFRQAPLNAGSVKSLQDLRGTPVLIEFWGTR